MSNINQSYDTISPGAFCPSTTERARDPGRLRSMLEVLSHDRLLDVITDLATRQPMIYSEIRAMLRRDRTQRRLFVRGLSRTCTNQDLIDAFSAYGPIDEAVVMKQKGTRCCKGFGFVTFADSLAADAAIQQPEMVIAGRMAIVSLAALGNKNKAAPMPPDPVGISMPGVYAPTQFHHPLAPVSNYSRAASGTAHKRPRNESPASSSSSHYDFYYPAAAVSQYQSFDQRSYEEYTPSPASLEKHRKQAPLYSDRLTPYSEQYRF